jgi:S1-C subfamily serine protease
LISLLKNFFSRSTLIFCWPKQNATKRLGALDRLQSGDCMKRVILCCLIIGCAVTGYAQVRNSIAIVKPDMTKDAADTYKNIAAFFAKNGDDKAASYYKNLAEGGSFGSGFLIADKDGKPLLVTNRHVVQFSETAELSFALDEDSFLKIPNCKVIYKDDAADLAFIAVPEDKVADIARLEFAKAVPEDGYDVWSAGYPGLGDKPAWQLGKGVITNRKIVVDEVGPAETSIYIQHSATIDPGNSGGPLMIRSEDNPKQFEVIGVNTLTSHSRQNTFFAVTLAVIKNTIANFEAVDTSTNDVPDRLSKKIDGFLKTLQEKNRSAFSGQRYIAYSVASQKAWTLFRAALGTMPAAERRKWMDDFDNLITIDVLREFLHAIFYTSLQSAKTSIALKNVELDKTSTDPRFKVTLSAADQEIVTTWGLDASNWRIIDADWDTVVALAKPAGTKISKAKAHQTSDSDDDDDDSDDPPKSLPEHLPRGFLFGGGLNRIPTITGWQNAWDGFLGYELGFKRVLSLNFLAQYDSGSSLVVYGGQATNYYLQGSVGLKLSGILPGNDVFMVPYIAGNIGAGLPMNSYFTYSISYSLTPSMGFMIYFNRGVALGFDLAARFELGDTGLARLNALPVQLYMIL